MRRPIVGFTQDGEGDWVAHLSCLHRQHVRHRPPFQDRSWVLVDAERQAHVGSDLECPLCDRTELPEDLHVVRTAGPWPADAVPAGLRRDHRVAAGTWGRLRVLEGSVTVSLAVEPPLTRTLLAGEEQPLPPEVPHHLILGGPVLLAVDFLVR